MLTSYQEETCPKCQASMPINPGFVTWCDQCDWNLEPQMPPEADGPFANLYRSLGTTRTEALLSEFENAEQLKTGLTLSKAAAYLIALTIHGFTFLWAILGMFLIAFFGTNWVTLLFVAGCFAAAWLGRPRFAPLPDGILEPTEAPRLYRLANDIADFHGLSGKVLIDLDLAFNASMVLAGWRGKRVVRLGLPFWEVLDDQERVAVLAHELAHAVNGDVSRARFVGSALNTLQQWYITLYPSGPYFSFDRLLPALLARLVYYAYSSLMHLLWLDKQRAEYLADYLAAQVSGTDAVLSTLDKQYYRQTFYWTVQQATMSGDQNELYTKLKERMAHIPERELERIRRVEHLANSRLEADHPPTVNRIRLLKRFPIEQPSITVLSSEMALIDGELADLREESQRSIINQYRAGLYY